jgi:hypothetical protein
MSAWHETKRPWLMVVGREPSLFLEFIALQPGVRFADNPILEKVGTESRFGRKIKKAASNRAFCQDVSLLLRSSRATIQGKNIALPLRAS